jgi:hypothetical protein
MYMDMLMDIYIHTYGYIYGYIYICIDVYVYIYEAEGGSFRSNYCQVEDERRGREAKRQRGKEAERQRPVSHRHVCAALPYIHMYLCAHT